MYILGYMHPKTGREVYVAATSSDKIKEEWEENHNSNYIYFSEVLVILGSEVDISVLEDLRYKD